MACFDLVDQPWIPCTMQSDGSTRSFGLRDVLRRAPEIREIVDSSPLAMVALHRPLLALLHRVFGPEDEERWAEIWRWGTFDQQKLDEYFAVWRDQRGRFDLFAEHHPFYQTASLDFGYAAPISRLAHELNLDTSNALFNHTAADAAGIAPAKAARYLIAYQAFAAGGLVTYERGQNPALFKSADAAPLTKGAVVLVKGESLFETLLLNLHRYDCADGEPFEFHGDDPPSWERDRETRAEDRLPDGYLDLLTWQSRRIRLRPETTETGDLVVRSVVIMKGGQFPDGFSRHKHETMLGFRRREDAKAGMDPWPAIAFEEGRALWRDSTALFQSAVEKQARPMTLEWLNDLIVDGVLDRAKAVPLDVAGLCVDRAKVNFWRYERLTLPLDYLGNRDLFDAIRNALELSEQVARVLDQTAWTLAARLLAPDSDINGGRQPDSGNVRKLADSLAIDRYYWPRLEPHFRRLLVALPEDVSPTADGVEYGRDALPAWMEEVRRSAWDAFCQMTSSLDTSARALKAAAQAERFFSQHLYPLLTEYRASFEEVTR